MVDFTPPISSRDTNELIEIVNGEGWQSEAVEQAKFELERRGISYSKRKSKVFILLSRLFRKLLGLEIEDLINKRNRRRGKGYVWNGFITVKNANCNRFVIRLLRIHFFSFFLLLVNILLVSNLDVGFLSNIVYVLKIALYTSALLLCFNLSRPLTIISIYLYVYLLLPVLSIILLSIEGIVGGLLLSLFFFFFTGPTTVVSDGNYKIKNNATGLLYGGYSYSIYENKYWLFEREIGEIRASESKDNLKSYRIDKGEISLTFKREGEKDAVYGIEY
ncbi:hypothetical protein [uncultured Acetobacteroides sp.]|uniref:hypothetical protein n=1 Tax=uncultured Acetobacteroides sp. TaxID=1760811 RepID=UPI0029F52849|nr:hypothetical protein [uncultured Acetobacteroides sp.]